MNDASELTYAARVVDETVVQVLTGFRDSAQVIERLGEANPVAYGRRPFVACFCEQPDLLSQWRAYGAGESAVALGLDLSFAEKVGWLPPNTLLRKVIYDRDAQVAAIREAVEAWRETFELLVSEGTAPQDLLPYPAIWALQRALLEHYMCFKHPGFAEEREWRAIKLVDVRAELDFLSERRRQADRVALLKQIAAVGGEMPYFAPPRRVVAEGIQICFREGGIGLIPFVDLPLRDRGGVFHGVLPLWEVLQGPSPNPNLTLDALRMLLDSRGYVFHTKLGVSAVPLRP
jgi:Protein of unknown function (DUF2971)